MREREKVCVCVYLRRGEKCVFEQRSERVSMYEQEEERWCVSERERKCVCVSVYGCLCKGKKECRHV